MVHGASQEPPERMLLFWYGSRCRPTWFSGRSAVVPTGAHLVPQPGRPLTPGSPARLLRFIHRGNASGPGQTVQRCYVHLEFPGGSRRRCSQLTPMAFGATRYRTARHAEATVRLPRPSSARGTRGRLISRVIILSRCISNTPGYPGQKPSTCGYAWPFGCPTRAFRTAPRAVPMVRPHAATRTTADSGRSSGPPCPSAPSRGPARR